jgi:glycosyltransferase involved in cell wall biosynthesis
VHVGVVEPFGQGGIGQYAYFLSQGLADAGAQVTLYTRETHELDRLPRSFKLAGILKTWDPHTHVRHTVGRAGRLAGTVARGLRYGLDLVRLGAAIDRDEPDVVHFQEILFAPDLVLLWWLRRRGLVLWDTVHNVRPFDYRPDSPEVLGSSRSSQWLSRRAYERFDGLVLPNAECERLFRERHPDWHGRAVVLPHGPWSSLVPESVPDELAAAQQLGLPEAGPYLVYFGVIRKYKGLPVLLDAFRMLRRRGVTAHLVVAGYPHSDCPPQSVRRAVEERELSDDVTLHLTYLSMTELTRHLAVARAVVLPFTTVFESASVLLAQAHGKPVIASRVGGVPDRVEDGRTGIVVSPGDAEGLSEAMERLIREPETAARMGVAAQGAAQGRPTWKWIGERLIEAYR